ncbi:uncharacterized protein LOC127774152 [Oryza glaberrima]|uniref:uncharacterized protein LOC127774152 n=1 Tax=Oryza glaberrima TaxID=4538 RepID=UPI00224C0D7E|nr:uncharacterized protein LOC127774152 [Oryza glaberrima]
MEPLLHVLAAAGSTVREGLNAQVQALAEERAALEAEWAQLAADRARVDEGRRAVDDMERRVSEADASLRAQTAALEAERRALDERARSAQEFETTIRRRIEVLDRIQREQNARGQEQAQRAQELERRARALEDRARLLDQRESTLAAHERMAVEVEASLRLREEAAAERDRITLTATASADRHAEELRLRKEACQERDVALVEHEAELSDAVDRLERAGRRVGISVRRHSKLPPTQPALVLRLDELAADLERLEEEVDETVKSSSASLARAAVELVLASHHASDPDFVPWRVLEDFPPGTEARAREQVREAADAIVYNFEGSAPRFTFGLASDEESGSGDDDDDVIGEGWDDVVSGAGLRGSGTP